MKLEDQRIAIAEACGWKWSIEGHWENEHYPGKYHDRPDYLTDLNAIHEAEKMLNFEQKMIYASKLWDLFCVGDAGYDFFLLHCTAEQRAEAFLRTIGKWKDQDEKVS